MVYRFIHESVRPSDRSSRRRAIVVLLLLVPGAAQGYQRRWMVGGLFFVLNAAIVWAVGFVHSASLDLLRVPAWITLALGYLANGVDVWAYESRRERVTRRAIVETLFRRGP